MRRTLSCANVSFSRRTFVDAQTYTSTNAEPGPRTWDAPRSRGRTNPGPKPGSETSLRMCPTSKTWNLDPACPGNAGLCISSTNAKRYLEPGTAHSSVGEPRNPGLFSIFRAPRNPGQRILPTELWDSHWLRKLRLSSVDSPVVVPIDRTKVADSSVGFYTWG